MPSPVTAPSLAEARSLVAALVPDDITDAGPAEDLRDYGLDSIRLMEVLDELTARGVALEFTELAVSPTLAVIAEALQNTATRSAGRGTARKDPDQ